MFIIPLLFNKYFNTIVGNYKYPLKNLKSHQNKTKNYLTKNIILSKYLFIKHILQKIY